MSKSFIAALAAALLACAAHAQTAAPTAKYSVDATPFGDLVNDPATKAVLDKDWPNYKNAPMEMVAKETLKAMSAYPQAGLNDDLLKKIQADFDALSK